MSNSSTSLYESENRRYQRTAQTMISGSKCRHLNNAGLGLIMEYTAAYQTRSLSSCNTTVCSNVLIVFQFVERRMSSKLQIFTSELRHESQCCLHRRPHNGPRWDCSRPHNPRYTSGVAPMCPIP